MVWPYGAENWCNLEGTHLHFVADLSHLIPLYGSFESSICTVGVFGTKYVRDGPSLPETLKIDNNDSVSLSIPHIYSELTISTLLAINLR